MSMKNPSDTIGNRTHDLPELTIVIVVVVVVVVAVAVIFE
jgi:hypothetical protein